MYYSIRHATHFRYERPVSESIMEVRMQPRTEGPQHCRSFQLLVSPRRRVLHYRDYLGNTVHHFDVPGKHRQLSIVAEALVDVQPDVSLPLSLAPDTWNELDAQVRAGDYWEMLMPSHYAQPSSALAELSTHLQLERGPDPLTTLRHLSTNIYRWFDYVPKSTSVDSPIDVALKSRQGVCQDFAHIMITLVRHLRVPARYVSGYLFHSEKAHDRSSEGASHAWVEVLLPRLGWVGFDPTNNLLAGERHIRTAIGRDYADVPPTKGIYKGNSAGELLVSVRVSPIDTPMPPENQETMSQEEWSSAAAAEADEAQMQQQQQQ